MGSPESEQVRPKSRYPQNWVKVMLSRRQKGHLICTPLLQPFVRQYGDDKLAAVPKAVGKMKRTRRKKRGCAMAVKFMKEMN